MKIEKCLIGKSGVYCLVNLKNMKKYIGSSKNLYNRIYSHFFNLKYNKHHSIHLQNSYNKYKKFYFTYFILDFCNVDNLEKNEQYFIDVFNPEYNKRLDSTRNTGLSPSKETRNKISETLKRKYKDKTIKTYHQNHLWIKSYVYDIETFKLIFEFQNLKEISVFLNRKGFYKRSLNTIVKNKYFVSNTKIDGFSNIRNYIYKNVYKQKKGYLVSINNNVINYHKTYKDCSLMYGIHESTILRNISKNGFYKKDDLLIKFQALYKPI